MLLKPMGGLDSLHDSNQKVLMLKMLHTHLVSDSKGTCQVAEKKLAVQRLAFSSMSVMYLVSCKGWRA